jgi:nucleotide-binding universal stress UspA family protein
MYNKILAPMDGSKLSECSIEHVAEIASGCHSSKVILLTVLKPIIIPGEAWSISAKQNEILNAEIQKEEAQIAEDARKYLSVQSENLKKAGINSDVVILKATETSEIAEAILDYAEKNNIDLIVMSTHGRSGPSRWAFGSVTDKVVRTSSIPVLTIAPAGCRI